MFYQNKNIIVSISVVFSVCLFAASCGNRHNFALDELMQANELALEQSVDMYNDKTETDNLLVLDRAEIDLGDLPLGEEREAKISATNNTDKSIVILTAATSCSCTKVEWSKKPILAGESTDLVVKFAAETEGVFFKKVAITHSAASRPISFTIRGAVIKNED